MALLSPMEFVQPHLVSKAQLVRSVVQVLSAIRAAEDMSSRHPLRAGRTLAELEVDLRVRHAFHRTREAKETNVRAATRASR